ncbi:hypothetical protein FRC00_002862 [Tulasnella sp. 408]|nr:hypothetical protein FRC00_002862 [Tulasnella sp. 408]
MTGRYLEAIGSPVYGANPVTAERPGPQLIPPPRNQLELGDRILTFWSIYSRDKASSIITGFASAIDDVHDDIITPLPRSPREYETNNVRPVDVERLSDIFSPPPGRAAERRPDTIFSSQLKGLTLLGRARAASPSPQTEQWERINAAIQRFLNGLFQTHPSLDSNSATQEPLGVGLATAVAAGYTAAIFLNADLSLTEPNVQQDRVRWAKTMATMMVGLPLEEAIKACAVFGYLLGKAAEILILHKKVAVARGLHDVDVELTEVDDCISRILEAIKSLTITYPALIYHVQRLVDAALRAEV